MSFVQMHHLKSKIMRLIYRQFLNSPQPLTRAVLKFLNRCRTFSGVLTDQLLSIKRPPAIPVPVCALNHQENISLTHKNSLMKISLKRSFDGRRLMLPALLMLSLFLLIATGGTAQITQVTGSPSEATTTSATLTITRPSGLAVDDIMIANIVQSDNDNATLSNATRSGWTVIDGRSVGSTGTNEWWGTVLYKVATASDVTSANFAFTLDADANGDGASGAIVAFRNVDVTGGFNATGTANSGPFDVDPGTISTFNSGTASATSTSTNTLNAAVIMFTMLGDNRTHSNWQTATGPLSLTEIYDQDFNTVLDNGSGAAWAIKGTAGSTGTGTATLSGTARGGALLVTLRCLTPTISTTGTLTPICRSNSAQTASLSYTATTKSPNAYSIDWNTAANTAGLTDQGSTANTFSGGAGTISNIVIPAAVPPGTYSGTMYITSATGCEATQAITLTINGPTANAGAALSAICQGGVSAALGGSVGGTATGGTWSDGGVGGTFSPNANTLNATWTPPGAYSGTATLTLTTTGGTCAATTASKTQVVSATAPAANAGPDASFCIAGTTLAANAPAPGTGTWSILAGSANTSTSQLSSTSNATATFTPTVAGAYTLRWTITNSGCTTTFDDVSFTVNPLPQVSSFSGNDICSGGLGELTAVVSGTAPFSITYNPGAITETGVTSGNAFFVTPSPVSTSNYTITLVTDANGCQRSSGFTDAAATINVSDPLTGISYSANPVAYCPGAAISANTATVSGGNATSYSLVSPGSLPAGLTLNTSTGAINGTPTTATAAADYTIRATNACGFTDVAVNITISPAAPAAPGTISGSAAVCAGTSTTYSISPVTDATGYTWEVPSGWSISSGQGSNSITVVAGTSGEGNINVTASNSCGSNQPSQVINISPENSSNNSGTVASNGTKTSDALTVTSSGNSTGFIKFPLTAIPSGANVTGATLYVTNNGSVSSSNTGNTVRQVAAGVDPVTASGSALYSAITSGTSYRTGSWSASGTIALSLSATADADIESRLSQGYIAMGLTRGATNVYEFYGYSGNDGNGTNAPVLTVNFSGPRSIAVSVIALPTVTPGANPSVSRSTTSAALPYSATTGSPSEYNITWNSAAITAGFADVSGAALAGSPISLTVPAAADAAVYNGILTVTNTSTYAVHGR